uniref:Sar s 1 allergen SMIPP-C Yv5009F04 n=1 Tax=Sarcoptes scabiei TaxID=52283 RepID=Q3L7L0_SARSC|nr:Sar s 1 allergen SMIPP-C Yv5009F04 [Sarcoptes scabiei]
MESKKFKSFLFQLIISAAIITRGYYFETTPSDAEENARLSDVRYTGEPDDPDFKLPDSFIQKFKKDLMRELTRKCRKGFRQARLEHPELQFCKIPKVFQKLPKWFDLRNLEFVTPTRDNSTESKCKASWAFGPVASMESAWLESHDRIASDSFFLSPQNLIDCAGYQGCDGGVDVIEAFNYMKHKGIVKEEFYKYRAKKHRCRKRLRARRYKIRSYCAICPATIFTIKKFLFKHKTALTTVISVRNLTAFKHIDDEILYEDEGTRVQRRLVVNIVGWRHDDATDRDYWVVKNSWGKKWGMGGYGFVDAENNPLHILDHNYLVRVKEDVIPFENEPEDFE